MGEKAAKVETNRVPVHSVGGKIAPQAGDELVCTCEPEENAAQGVRELGEKGRQILNRLTPRGECKCTLLSPRPRPIRALTEKEIEGLHDVMTKEILSALKKPRLSNEKPPFDYLTVSVPKVEQVEGKVAVSFVWNRRTLGTDNRKLIEAENLAKPFLAERLAPAVQAYFKKLGIRNAVVRMDPANLAFDNPRNIFAFTISR